MAVDQELLDAMQVSKAWPYAEAMKLAGRDPYGKVKMTFETGYGPSGLPHIGTFAEVYRTTLVRRAYEDIMGYAPNANTRLIVFSDDLDALRSVPDNIPNAEEMQRWIGYSVSCIPDPFGQFESFAHHNNAMLCNFLDQFEFDYEFRSASSWYRTDEAHGGLRVFHEHHDLIRDIIVPTLGDDRAATYSPFLPITEDGKVLQAEIIDAHSVNSEMLIYRDPDTRMPRLSSIFDCKLQWKADWAMRWYAQEIDYEMCGKDLTDSVKMSSEIVRALGWKPPQNLIYEMFLDEEGHKISKSKGNGLHIEQWLTYADENSLRYYLFQSPQKARELSLRAVVRAQDDYFDSLARYPTQTAAQKLGNAVHHFHRDGVPAAPDGVSYALLLNVCKTVVPNDPATLAKFVKEQLGHEVVSDPVVNRLILNVWSYFWDHVRQDDRIRPRTPTEYEANAIRSLITAFTALPENVSAESIQFEVYEVGKCFYPDRLRDWFAMLYEVTLGQNSGPRFGAFAKLLGLKQTIELLQETTTTDTEI